MDFLSLAAAAAIPVGLFAVYAVLRYGIRVLTRPGRRRAHVATMSGPEARLLQQTFELPTSQRASAPILSKVSVSRPAAPAPDMRRADAGQTLSRDLVAVGPGRSATQPASRPDPAVARSRDVLTSVPRPVNGALGQTSSRPPVEPEWPSHTEFPYVHAQLRPGDEASADACPVCAESRARGARFCRRCGRPVFGAATHNGGPAASRRGLGLLRGSLQRLRGSPHAEDSPAVGQRPAIAGRVPLDELATLAGPRERTARPQESAQPAFALAEPGVRVMAPPEARGAPTNGDVATANGGSSLDQMMDAARSFRTLSGAPDAGPARAERVPVLHVKARVAGHGTDRPDIDEERTESPGGRAAGGVTAAPRLPRPAAASTVDLNRATVAELVTLPGIGQATARRIVASREEVPFPNVDALKERKVLGATVLAKVRDLLEVR